MPNLLLACCHSLFFFLKVRGVERLRVADASVLPTVPNGNVHATVVAVAHRAAEIIVAEAAGRSV